MKELSIEEKAKAYDRVSKEVKDFFEGRQKMYSDVNQTLEFLFPELKKSKDEKIRKAIIALVKQSSEILAEQNQNNMIAWLNKQGEYKSPEEVLKIRQELYQSGYNDGYKHGCEVSKKGEKKHKFIIGDTIISDNNTIYRVENIVQNCIGQDCYFLVNIESENKGMRYFEMTDPQGKKYNFGEITWLCEQVDAKFEKQSEHHIACSEEDENAIKVLMNIIRKSEMIDSIIYTDSLKEKLYDWLKSLRPQNNITDEELAQAKKNAYNDALDKIEYHSGEPTFDDGWSAAIDYIRKKSLRPQNVWINVDKEVYVKEPVLAQKIDKSDPFKGYVVCCDHTLVPNVYERYMLLSNIISQNTWKVSDEQMKVLDEVLNFAANHESPYWNYYIFETLNNLIRQLKTENIKL